jgi:hypothetical protein
MALGPVEIYRYLPKTNCGECGHPSCLAFATALVRFGESLAKCPYVDQKDVPVIEDRLRAHYDSPGRSPKVKEDIAGDTLREKIKDHDFGAIHAGLGLEYLNENGEDTLLIPYFDTRVALTRKAAESLDGSELDPWDEVLVYNYVFFSGSEPPSGKWVGLESFPNSVSKRAALEEVCHAPIAKGFGGRAHELERVAKKLGGERVTDGHNADLAFRFHALPRVPLLLLFWDEAKDEGFDAQARVLYDEGAMEYFDLECLIFCAEKLTQRLLGSHGHH